METNKELIDQLREYAGNAGYSHHDYADMMRLAAAALSQRSEAVPYQVGTIGHIHTPSAEVADACAGIALSSAIADRKASAPSAAAGEQVPAWDVDATTRLRSIVDLLGLQSSVPDGDLTGYEFTVLGIVRREIERLKAAALAKQGEANG